MGRTPKIDTGTLVLSSTDLGRILGLSEKYVRDLATEGVLEKTPQGRYELSKNVQRYVNYIKAKGSMKTQAASTTSNSHENEKMLKTKANREKAELELAVMKGQLHKAEDVEYVLSDMITAAKTKLLGLPSKIAPEIMGEMNIAKIQALIYGQIEEALMELTEYTPEMFANDDMIDPAILEGEDDNDES